GCLTETAPERCPRNRCRYTCNPHTPCRRKGCSNGDFRLHPAHKISVKKGWHETSRNKRWLFPPPCRLPRRRGSTAHSKRRKPCFWSFQIFWRHPTPVEASAQPAWG